MKYSDFDTMTDVELLHIIHTESADSAINADIALDYLINRHKQLVLSQAHSLYLTGADKEDLIQEGMIGLYKAIRSFDEERSASFSAFATSIIQNQMFNAIKAYNRKKYRPLNESVSLDAPIDTDGGDNDTLSLADVVKSPHQTSNPEDLVIDKEKVSMIEYELGKCLSPLEKTVYNLYIEGMDYRQIAERLGKTPKAIDNARSRIKIKLSKLLDDMLS